MYRTFVSLRLILVLFVVDGCYTQFISRSVASTGFPRTNFPNVWGSDATNLHAFGGEAVGFNGLIDLSNETYSFKSGIWSVVPVGSARPAARMRAAYWQTAGHYWLWGGVNAKTPDGFWNITSGISRFNPAAETWDRIDSVESGVWPEALAGTAFTQGTTDEAWIYGGVDSLAQLASCLWRFQTDSSLRVIWTPFGDVNARNQLPLYSPTGNETASPGSRMGASLFWVESTQSLYLFGGFATHGLLWREFNDLWKFDLSTRSWTFITGQQGMAPPQDNRFPAPRSDALRWVENDTYLCIFGGFTIRGMFYQDMWRFDLRSQTWSQVLNLGDFDIGRRMGAGVVQLPAQSAAVVVGGWGTHFQSDSLRNIPYQNDVWLMTAGTPATSVGPATVGAGLVSIATTGSSESEHVTITGNPTGFGSTGNAKGGEKFPTWAIVVTTLGGWIMLLAAGSAIILCLLLRNREQDWRPAVSTADAV